MLAEISSNSHSSALSADSTPLPLPSPVTLIATQCIAQTATLSSVPVDPEKVKLLFRLKPFFIDDVEDDLSIQQKLNLTDAESTLLDEMIKRWCHLKEMTLHNICGVSIYIKILALMPEVDEKVFAEIAEQFSISFFDTYLRFERDSMKVATQDVTFQNTYIPTWALIKNRFKNLLESIIQNCSSRPRRSDISKKLARSIERTIKSIGDEIQLFIKMYEHEQGKSILSCQPTHLLKDEEFVQSTTKGIDSKIDHLSCYARFIHSMIAYTHKDGECLFFDDLRQHLPMLSGDKIFEGINVLQSDLNACFALITQEQPKLERTIRELLADKITHADWAKNHNIQPLRLKGKEEFLEQMLFHVAFFFKIDFFAGQFQKCLEHEVVRLAYPKFASTENHIQRFLYNCKNCTKVPTNLQIEKFHHHSIANFGKSFCKKIAALEGYFNALLENSEFIKISRSDFSVLRSDFYSRGIWNYKFSKFSFITFILDSAKIEMVQATDLLNKELKETLDKFHDLTVSEKNAIINDIQALCIEQSLFLIRMVMVAEDISAVINGSFSFEPQPIPQELIHFIHLDALDEFLTGSRRNSTISQVDEIEPQQSNRSERRLSQQLVSIHDLVDCDFKNGNVQQEEKVKKETDLEALKEAALTRKTYKILQAFLDSGYTIAPGKHKHIKLRKPGEPPVTLPRALEQGYGMSQYIFHDMLREH